MMGYPEAIALSVGAISFAWMVVTLLKFEVRRIEIDCEKEDNK